jgi:NADH-quinone oxidoreductase subunit N
MSALGLEFGIAALALLVLVVDLIRPGTPWTGRLTTAGLAALALLPLSSVLGVAAWGGTYTADATARFLQVLFLGSGFLTALGSLGEGATSFPKRQGEYYLLLLTSIGGMSLLAGARDLVLLFVAFELMSVPLFAMTAIRKDERGVEGALKFYLSGVVASAVLLYGLSLLYGAMGTTTLAGPVPAGPLSTLAIIGLLAGFGFKLAAFPFHMWLPDAYEAAPASYVAFLSVAPKAAGFAALLRLLLEPLGGQAAIWMPLVAALAAVTMVAGNLMALPQKNLKRLLAYSGIAHIGYMLLGLAAGPGVGAGMLLFYLAAYLVSNAGAFLVVSAVERATGSSHIDAVRGLAQTNRGLALAMLLCLLSLAGIPFVIGFWAKLYIFVAAARAHLLGLVLLGALASLVGLYYYLLVAKRMYIDAPAGAAPFETPRPLAVAIWTAAVLATVGGLYHAPLLAAALDAAGAR